MTQLAPTAQNYMNAFMGQPGNTLAPTAANYINAVSGSGAGTGGFFSDLGNLGDALGGFLGGTGGQLIGAGLKIDELNKITDIAQRSAAEQARIGREAQEASAFRPFTVSTGFGGVTTTPEGGFTTSLSPAMAAQQQQLQSITSGLLGGMGGMGGGVAPNRFSYGPVRPPIDVMRQPGEGQGYAKGPVSGGPAPLPPMTVFQTSMSPEEAMAARISGTRSTQAANPPSLQEVLAGRGFTMPEMPRISSQDVAFLGTDPVTGRMRQGGSTLRPYYKKLDEMYAQNPEALEIAKQYTADPFQFGGKPSPTGSLQQLIQQPPQAPMAPATGGFGSGIPDVSGITGQALGGLSGALTGLMAPMGQREADVYERIRATQRPEEERARLALEERLQSQGRTGLRTAQFGGAPEQLALAQAQEEAKNRAALGALGQAQAEQQQQLGLAQGLFGLGSGAAALPASLQGAQLGNIGAAMGLQYLPEQQLLATLDPAVNLANIAGTAQRQGAGYMSQAGISGLEDILQAETVRSQNLRDIYSSILGAQSAQQQAAGQAATNTGLFSSIGNIGTALLDFFR